jgi:hypothetical protein
MTIFSGLMVLIYSILIGVVRSTKDTTARNNQITQTRLGMMQIDRQVRSGNVLSDPAAETVAGSGVAANYSLRVYTQADGVFQCVQWRARFTGTIGVLEYRSWKPGWISTDDVTQWRVVARDLAAPTGTQPKPFQRITSAGGSRAQSIDVTLFALSPGSKGRVTSISSVLTGRNTVYGYPSDQCASIPPP